MGIYVFEADVLVKALEADAGRDSNHDFGKDILPALIGHAPVVRLPVLRREQEGRRSTGATSATLDAYYEANMDLVPGQPGVQPLRPRVADPHVAGAGAAGQVRVRRRGQRCGQALDSIISAGCIVSGSRVRGSILCPNVRVHSFCDVDRSILMPGVRVGRHARIRRAIIDRDVFIPRGACIGYNPEEDRKRHTVTESGIVVVTTDDEPLRRSADRGTRRRSASGTGAAPDRGI